MVVDRPAEDGRTAWVIRVQIRGPDGVSRSICRELACGDEMGEGEDVDLIMGEWRWR